MYKLDIKLGMSKESFEELYGEYLYEKLLTNLQELICKLRMGIIRYSHISSYIIDISGDVSIDYTLELYKSLSKNGVIDETLMDIISRINMTDFNSYMQHLGIREYLRKKEKPNPFSPPYSPMYQWK